MIRVAAFTQGLTAPSARFRIRQLIPALEERSIQVVELPSAFSAYPPADRLRRPYWLIQNLLSRLPDVKNSFRFDITLFQRELISTIPTLECFTKKPRIVDVDDAIWLYRRGIAAHALARVAEHILCGNNYIADYFSRFGKTVTVVPTAVDTDRFTPLKIKKEQRIIGWSGSSSGFKYLEMIQPALRIILEKHPDAIFKVISDQRPNLRQLPPLQFKYVQWSQDIEVSELQDLSVGIMPLADTLWERGKCSFKMLTYMAVEVPVVVSPVGMNVEVLADGTCGYAAVTLDDWVDAISAILNNESSGASMGEAGREIVRRKYSTDVIAGQIAGALQGFMR